MTALSIDPTSFAAVLRGFREGKGRSRNNLAHEVGVDPSYLTRCENGGREPPRYHIVEGLARALELPTHDANRLYVSAGYTPKEIRSYGDWDSCLQAVTEVLTDCFLTEDDKAEFRATVTAIARRWRPNQ